MKTNIKQILGFSEFDREITVKGWVRTRRGSSNVSFVALNDGSTIKNLQIVIENDNFDVNIIKAITTGACIAVEGTLVKSQGSGQTCEVLAKKIEILGESDADKYPIQPKAHTMEYLRENAHLRPRTNTFSAVFRVRHALAFAIHKYFNDNGFFYWHSPIITASDAEGAGQMFHVSTLNPTNPPKNEDGAINYKEDFFGAETSLTVSGQLEGELGAMALGLIYTFGPTFRAENSNTARHLAEFWMIEPEMAFYDIQDNMDLVENFLKYVIHYALENCPDDLEFLDKRFAEEEKKKKQEERSEMGLLEKLNFIVSNQFERLTYTEAIEILLNSSHHKKKKFEFEVKWGIDLQSEHERYLVEKHFKKPVILTNYPKAIKAFYMKQNEGEEVGKETVRAMDVLFPGIGEIVGGSQREENYDKLMSRINEVGIDPENLWWYLDTRKFGTCPHSGFGLGFERLMLFVTGMGNIRDVIPFPRTPQNAKF
ncbi:MAG: asparagine--tRNA ligase [Microscillaceae bacterium]|jgi:asparaginyl-tRNA synthetase|nr:asparagine--tRNA ligase [Microscillaceae bacterium]